MMQVMTLLGGAGYNHVHQLRKMEFIMSDTHPFQCQLEWLGGQQGPAADAATLDRTHRLSFEGRPEIVASSAPDYGGNPGLLNPEELLTAALSSCQMLTCLVVFAKSHVPVYAYQDHAEGFLEKGDDGKLWMTRVILRPVLTLKEGTSEERARFLVEKAHANCFIANSVRTQVTLEPRFQFV